MARVRLTFLLALVAMIPLGSARADLTPVAAPDSHATTSQNARIANTDFAVAGSAPALDEVNWLLKRAASDQRGVALPIGPVLPVAEAPKDSGVTPLPAGPNGLALGLSALTSLAAVQACRSLRKLHLSALPEWYHTGGPMQVGHATPYQLDHAPLAVCDFEQPSDLRPGISYRIPRELRSRLRSQFFLLVESPRGPPSLS